MLDAAGRWHRWVGELAATDPGLVRLRSASATTLTLVLALGVLVPLSRVLGQSLPVAMLGTVVATFAASVVRDKNHRERIITTVLVPLPACASASLAAVLNQYGFAADLGFIGVLFVATWVRRFGARGTALGMVAFTAYFFVLFLRAQLHQLPALLLSIIVGVAVALLVRTVLLPDRPRVLLRRLARALRRACRSTVAAAVDINRGALPTDSATLRRRLDRLARTALMIEEWLDTHDAALHLTVDGSEMSLRVFDAQLATEQLVAGLRELEIGQPWPPELSRAMVAVMQGLREDVTDVELRAALNTVTVDAEAADTRIPSGRTVFTAGRAVRAYQAVHEVQVIDAQSTPRRTPAEANATDSSARTGLQASTKAALQVALATAAATGIGEWISPSRWYWAVLAAFVVFTGTTSRGDILTRAWQRVLGTLTGVVAGVLLAALVGQDSRVQLALMVVCVFVAFYLAALSSTAFVFFFTVLLAMLYGVLGTFSVEVLELRLLETAAGAVVGIIAAFLVLPTRTRATVTGKLGAYLDRLDTLVDQSVHEVLQPSGKSDLIAMSRELDTALAELHTAAAPLVSRFVPRVRSSTRQWLSVMRVCDHYARPLARAGFAASVTGAAAAPEPAVAEALSQATAQVRDHLTQLQSVLHGAQPAPAHPALPGLRSVLAAQPPGPPNRHARRLRSTVFALVRIDRAVLELLPGEAE